jgi:hypothetical protein
VGDVKNWTNGETNGSLSREKADIGENFDGEALVRLLPQSGTPPSFSMAAEITKPSRIFKRAISDEVKVILDAKAKSLQIRQKYMRCVEKGGAASCLDDTEMLMIKKGSVVGFLQAHEIHVRLAGKVAKSCFDDAGMVDRAQVEAWHDFLADRENFRGAPYDDFPLFEHVRFQMFCVLGHLRKSHKFVDILEGTNVTPLGAHGQVMLEVAGGTMRPSELILTSLLSSHRQKSLPTCIVNSWINNMLFNNPEQLAEMYASALAKGQFQTPSGRLINLPWISDGRVSVDLEEGGIATKFIFKEVNSWIPGVDEKQIEAWREEGITYDAVVARDKLSLPVRDLNDLCFAGLFQAAFGDGRINNDIEYGTMHLLSGFPIGARDASFYSGEFFIKSPNDIPNLITELKQMAQIQRNNGANYMRMAYEYHPDGGHAFNANIAELLTLDLDKMKDGEMRSIGDCNYTDSRGIDIMRLAIKRTAEGFRLGQAYYAESQSATTKFKPMNFTLFMVHKTEVM